MPGFSQFSNLALLLAPISLILVISYIVYELVQVFWKWRYPT